MEEKKTIKIGLSGVFLILLVIVIGVMAFFIYKLNDEKITAAQQLEKLEHQIDKLEDSIETLGESNNVSNTNKVTQTDKENNTQNITNIKDIETLLKNEKTFEYLRIVDIQETNGNYLVKANYYVPIKITEEQYNEMVNTKKIILNNEEYVFDSSINEYNSGYGGIYKKGQNVESGYLISKSNGGYIFTNEIGGVVSVINEKKNDYLFYLDKNIEVYDIIGNEEGIDLDDYLLRNTTKPLIEFFTTVNYDKDDEELRLIIDYRRN